jgi:hypothetical protein
VVIHSFAASSHNGRGVDDPDSWFDGWIIGVLVIGLSFLLYRSVAM